MEQSSYQQAESTHLNMCPLPPTTSNVTCPNCGANNVQTVGAEPGENPDYECLTCESVFE